MIQNLLSLSTRCSSSLCRILSAAVSLMLCVAFVNTLHAKVLDSIAVEGLVINQAAVVLNAAGIKRGSDFTAADIQDAIKSMYRLGLFRSVNVYTFNETDSTASLAIVVEENPICEAIEYAGNKKLKQKDFEEKLTLKVGQTATDVLLYENAQILKKLYAEKGYLRAEVQTDIIPTKVPGNAIIKFKFKEGVKVRIKDIAFRGNKAISNTKLKWKFKTKEDRWWRAGEYDEDAYGKSKDSLIMHYNDLGYLDAAISEDSVRFDANQKDIHIILSIEEGKKYYVGDFFFSGNTVIASDSLKERIALKKGKVFQKSKFDMTKYLLEDTYREEGYLWVKVADNRSYRNDTIDVTFDIAEGRAAVVRKIVVGGNTKTQDRVVRREIVLMPGQKYKQSRMSRSARELMQLNFFNNVKPDLKPNEDGTIDLVFDVEEKDNIGQLSLGAAYSGRDGFVGTFSTSIPNFRGTGQTVDLSLEYGFNRRHVSLGLVEPWAFDYPIRLSGSIYYDYVNYATTHEFTESYGFTVGAGRRLTWPDDYFRIDGSYQLSKEDEQRNGFYAGKDSLLHIPKLGLMSKLWLTLQRNDTDVPNFPNRGSIFSITPEIAGLAPSKVNFAGDVLNTYRYLKGTVAYDWYFPMFWKFVLATKTKFGLIQPLPGSNQMTIGRYNLFNAGGTYTDGTIRGYADYTFGGSFTPEKGIALMVLSSAIQFPIMEQQLYFSIFGDMGNTWGSLSQVDFGDMYKGTGFGIRLLVPMLGLMGFDFAWKLDNPDRTHFSNDPGNDRFFFHFLMNRGF